MIKCNLNNEILKLICAIESNRQNISNIKFSKPTLSKLRKLSKRKSSYASNRIEGNPLSLEQAQKAIDTDPKKHLLKPEQEIRNYYLALNYLEDAKKANKAFSKKLILDVQKLVVKGASKEKIGLRGPMPPGVLFAVYDSISGTPEYIPPEYSDISDLIDELIDYVNTTDDHPLIIAAIVHYQLVTIHPFEDGNGRCARLLSSYILDMHGYGFNGIGSLEEYFAYDIDEYYSSLQMGLPALYYDGRNNPPNPQIWLCYFLRMVLLYSNKLNKISHKASKEVLKAGITYLNSTEKATLEYLLENSIVEFAPIEIAKQLGVSNRTIINRATKLVKNGFLSPVIVNVRVRSYVVNEDVVDNKKFILSLLKN